MEIKLEGTAPSPAEKYKILLKAEGSLTSPMPSGSTDEGYVLSIKGSGTEKLPVLSFESPGVHTYTISQIKGSNSQCSYDETVYTMKVYVTNNENGPGLVSEIVLTVPGMDGKPEHIIFVNKYPTVPDDPDDPDGPQTGDSSHLWLYICLGAVSLTALVTLFLTKRRKSEQLRCALRPATKVFVLRGRAFSIPVPGCGKEFYGDI